LFEIVSSTSSKHAAPEVFWDKVRLEDDKPWEKSFVEALGSSRIFVPVLCANTLASFVDHQGIIDDLLLEFMLALELFRAGRILAIIPVVYGEITADGGMSHIEWDAALASLDTADFLPAKTTGKLLEHASALRLPMGSHNTTFCSVIHALLEHNSVIMWDMDVSSSGGWQSLQVAEEVCVERLLCSLHDVESTGFPQVHAGEFGKFVSPAHTMVFHDITAWMDGLTNRMTAPYRSIADELKTNGGGEFWPDFQYVVHERAKERVKLDENGKPSKSSNGQPIIEEQGHDGWDLSMFMALPSVKAAKLTEPQLAVLRLYTGRLYTPWNTALRFGTDIDKWATCCAVLYQATLQMSLSPMNTNPAKLFRGVDETKIALPDSFLRGTSNAGFAGGVEPAFMSTTSDLQVAYDYSGGRGKPGTIFELEPSMTSRGANLAEISMFPGETEYLFTPCTSITVFDIRQDGMKKRIRARAEVSPARYCVDEIVSVYTVPSIRSTGSEPEPELEQAPVTSDSETAPDDTAVNFRQTWSALLPSGEPGESFGF
jgi:hypothetical protein